MAGKSVKKSNFSLVRDGITLEQSDLVDVLNEFYTSVNSKLPPIDVTTLTDFVPADNIPSRILKNFAFEPAEPVSIIFNESLQSGIVSTLWKDYNIIPIHKTQPRACEGDTYFVVCWMIEDTKDKIDPRQFECFKGTSTTYCKAHKLRYFYLLLYSRDNKCAAISLQFQ